MLHCGWFAAAVVIGHNFARVPEPPDNSGSFPYALGTELHHHPDIEAAPVMLQQVDAFCSR